MLAINALRLAVLIGQLTTPVSTCDLQHPARFLGHPIVVASLMVFTSHGAFLRDDFCRRDASDVVVLTPKTEGAPKVDFDVDAQSLEMLKPFHRPLGPSTWACVTLAGQVFVKSDFRVRSAGAGPVGNGYGPRGAFRLAFVMESIKEIHSCPAPASAK